MSEQNEDDNGRTNRVSQGCAPARKGREVGHQEAVQLADVEAQLSAKDSVSDEAWADLTGQAAAVVAAADAEIAKRFLAMGISEEFRPRLSWAEASALTGGPAAPKGAPVALGAGGSTDKALDPAAAKALLCERISAVLGVRICRLVKFAGKQPTFRMELEEKKVEFFSVRKLMSQSAVREEIAASTGLIIRKFKGRDWDQLVQDMLDACVIEQGGEENEREGAARTYVAHYLAETGFLDTLEGQQVQNQRKPIVLDGKVAICASDLQRYVNQTMRQILSVKAVASMLGALGGQSIRVRGQKFKEQGRWVLPLDQFDPAEYSRKTEESTSDAI